MSGLPELAERNAEIGRLYRAGMTTRDLATKFGVTHQRISMILAAEGVSIRPAGQRGERRPRPKARKLSTEQLAEALKQYESGKRVSEIAAMFGVRPHYITAKVTPFKRTGLLWKKLRHPQEQDVIRRYQAGETSVEIAKDYDVTPDTIIKVLARRGIQRRPRFGRAG